jgi:predicted amidohydrolase YtcJ
MRKSALKLGADRAVQAGLTTVQDPELSSVMSPEPFLEALAVGPTLPVRHVVWCQTSVIPHLQGTDLPHIGACIFADGAPGAWTGALFEPYSDRPGTRGVLYRSDQDANAFVVAAHRLGHVHVRHQALGLVEGVERLSGSRKMWWLLLSAKRTILSSMLGQ